MNRADLRTKDILNPSEAIELYVLSQRKFYKLLETKPAPALWHTTRQENGYSGWNSRNT